MVPSVPSTIVYGSFFLSSCKLGSLKSFPTNLLVEKIVFLGFYDAFFLEASPISRASTPNEMYEGVMLCPS